MHIKKLTIIFLLLIIASCVVPENKVKESKAPFQRPYYTFLYPDGDNWRYFHSNEGGQFNLVFGKKPPSQTHTISGIVSETHVYATFENPDEFLEYIKKSKELNMDPRRFKTINHEMNLDDKFGDYSMRYYSVTEDHKAENRGYKEFLLLKLYGYTFIHPYFKDIIVDISYSERGLPEEINPNFQGEAEKFINKIILKQNPDSKEIKISESH